MVGPSVHLQLSHIFSIPLHVARANILLDSPQKGARLFPLAGAVSIFR